MIDCVHLSTYVPDSQFFSTGQIIFEMCSIHYWKTIFLPFSLRFNKLQDVDSTSVVYAFVHPKRLDIKLKISMMSIVKVYNSGSQGYKFFRETYSFR